jgi:hypothetical protein
LELGGFGSIIDVVAPPYETIFIIITEPTHALFLV